MSSIGTPDEYIVQLVNGLTDVVLYEFPWSQITWSRGRFVLHTATSSRAATRYWSVAQAPRSRPLQRAEQNGRCLFSATHATALPQAGQLTVRGDAGLTGCTA